MVERRSIGNAIMTPDKIAFIKGAEVKTQEPAKTKEVELATESSDDTKPAERKPKAAKRSPKEEYEPAPNEVLDEILVSRTARFQYRTAQALTRAHLERKLKRQKPTTQQEIIETAVQHWLKEHGYLD